MRSTFIGHLPPHGITKGIHAAAFAIAIGCVALLTACAPGANEAETGLGAEAAADTDPIRGLSEQREAIRSLGLDLCRPGSPDELDERQELRDRLGVSLGTTDVEEFWTRAVRGKQPAQLDAAFFGCTSLTDWMRDRAVAEGVELEAIIAAHAESAPVPVAASPPPEPQSPPEPTALEGTVTRVVDGDTIKVESRGFETTVRLLGIDTPETVHPSEPVQCFGPEATQAAEALLPPGTTVTLETDPSQDTRDRFGRLLAYIYVDGASGAESINRQLVREGVAKLYVFDESSPFRYRADFADTEADARAAERGLWGPPCFGVTDGPAPVAEPVPPPPAAAPAPLADIPEPEQPGCDPNYSGACVPEVPFDLNCPDIAGSVTVIGYDHHGFDRDGDGFGCE